MNYSFIRDVHDFLNFTFIQRSAKTVSWILFAIFVGFIVFGYLKHDSSLVWMRPQVPKPTIENGNESPRIASNLWFDFCCSFFFQMDKFDDCSNFIFIYNKNIKNSQRCLTWMLVKTKLFDRSSWHLQSIHMKKLPIQWQNIWKKNNPLTAISKTF